MKFIPLKISALAICLSIVFVQPAFSQEKSIVKIDKKLQGGSYKSAYNTSKKLYLKNTNTISVETKITLLLQIAASAEAIYKYKEVDSLIQIAQIELQKVPSDSARIYASSYNLMAKVYLQANNINKALEFAEKSIEITNTKLNGNLIFLTPFNFTKAKIYAQAGYNNEALGLLNQTTDAQLTFINNLTNSKKVLKQAKRDYADMLNLKAAVFLNKGSYNSFDSLIARNETWMKKQIGKRNFQFRNHLANKGYRAKQRGNLKLATKYFEEANKYTKFKPSEKIGQNVQEELIEIYYQRNKKHESIVQRIKFERKARYTYGRNSLAYVRYRLQEIDQLYYDSKYDKAEKKLNNIYKTKTYLFENHQIRYTLLDLKVKIATRRSSFDIALDSLQKIVALKRLYYGPNSPEFHREMLRLSEFYTNYSNNFLAARDINEKSFNGVMANQLSPQSKAYVTYQQQLASLFELTEKYDLSIKYLEDAAKNINTYNGKENVDYAKDLEKLASVMLKKGDYVKAEQLIKEAVAIFKNTSSSKSSAADQSATYLTLAKLYTTLGLYDEAESALSKSAKLSKRSRKSNASGSAKSADELADLYIRQGRYNEAEDLLISTLQLKESKLGKENRDLIPTLNTMGNLYLILGNYNAAEKNIRRSQQITAKIFTENSTKYAESLRLTESLYKELGDLKKAEETAKQVLALLQNLLGKNHIDVASALTQYAQVKLYNGGDAKESEKLLLEALAIVKFNLGDKNPAYAEQMKNIASLYIETKRYEKADSAFNIANAIYIEKLGKTNINTAEIAFLKGNVAIQLKKYTLAQAKYEESRSAYAKLFSNKHPGYVKATSKLAKAYYMTGNYDKSLKLINESTTNYLDFTKKYFPSLSFSEKSKFWNQIKDDFEFFNSLAFKLMDKNSAVAGQMYDNIMSTKALLLSSSIKVKQRILNSKDEKLIAKYNEWTSKKQLLVTAISMSPEAQQLAGLNPDKLEKEINSLEKELSESSELFAQNFEKLKPSWKMLRLALKPNEYAVEMLRFRYFDKNFTDSVVYAALIVSKNSAKSPEVVVLSEGKKLETRYLKYYKNVVINKSETDDYSYDVFWKEIKAKIPDNKTIYFSSEGVYNELNVESLQAADGSYPIDRNDIVPISNTRDLLTNIVGKLEFKKPEALSASKLVLFGNPTFYASAAKFKQGGKEEDRSIARPDIYASASTNVIAQLPGTEIEVNEINKLFQSKGWKINKYLLDQAEEDSIKQMRSPKILHIATHGYFNPDEIKTDVALSGAESEYASNPLLRSGLLMRNAGDVLKSNNSLKINSENGVLTAYEAMDLNLDNTDLVVLSACETGKGEVQIGEGVFGLQRAILVSGAKTLVMTLFKVNDDITKELMIVFYKRWLETGELRKSFTE
ncbi:MAG: tetratricopeptide repeat protein, partial [Cytophagales bacterium]